MTFAVRAAPWEHGYELHTQCLGRRDAEEIAVDYIAQAQGVRPSEVTVTIEWAGEATRPR
jgi:hypothetical protein